MRKINIDRSIVTGVSLTIISGMLSWAAITKAVTSTQETPYTLKSEANDRLDDMEWWIDADITNEELKAYYRDNIQELKEIIELL